MRAGAVVVLRDLPDDDDAAKAAASEAIGHAAGTCGAPVWSLVITTNECADAVIKAAGGEPPFPGAQQETTDP